MKLVCFILIVFPFTLVNGNGQPSQSQADALIAIKQALHDPNDVLSSWFIGNPFGWSHITCNSTNGDVQRVDLGDAELAGTLDSQLGTLSSLQYLELYDNNIIGSIPNELGNLTSLISLVLSNNSLSGYIPKEFGNLKNLKFFRLNDNNLSGSVPDALVDRLKDMLNKDPYAVVDLKGNPYLCGEFTDNKCAPN